MRDDPFAQLKLQREAWAIFSPQATFTAAPAALLVQFAGIRSADVVLDVACGTGVVAVTAARAGAKIELKIGAQVIFMGPLIVLMLAQIEALA
jgi:tRNA G10  N-methylase Trm11